MGNNDVQMIEILLVEDNPEDRKMTLRALSRYNLTNRVIVAKDGEEALDFIFGKGVYQGRNTNNNPRVILLDLRLPKIDGKEVLKQLRANEKTKHIPVVVLTSSEEDRDVIETYDLGINSYIVKPVDFDKFMNSIAEIGLYWVMINKPPIV